MQVFRGVKHKAIFIINKYMIS